MANKKKILKILLMLIVVFIIATCYYDNEEFLYPKIGSCDTTNVTYSQSVQPILSSKCYQCHSSSSGGTKLEAYSDVKISADNGSLLGTIEHTGSYPLMPPSGKLDDCSIATIKIWIESGAPNN